MSSANDPKPPKKNGSAKDPATKKPKAGPSKPFKADAIPAAPVIKNIPASELAQWAVHPLADRFPMVSGDNLKRLGNSLESKQEYPVILWRNMVLDGRNRIAAGVLNDLTLWVEIRDELTEEEAERLIIALNIERRSTNKSTLVEMAVEFHAARKGTKKAMSFTDVADLFGVGRRTIFNFLARQNQPPKPRKPRASFDRIPPDLHVVAVAISHMWVFENSATRRHKHKRFREEFKEIANEFMSEPEMQRFFDRMNPNIGMQDNPQDDPQDDSQDDPQDDPQDDLGEDVTS